MLYDDKYDNHFLNIVCGRARFIKFGEYTLTAIQAADMPAGLTALVPGLTTALADFRADVVTRIGADGTTQANTETEDDQWDDIHEFLTETDVVILRPAYFKEPHRAEGNLPQQAGRPHRIDQTQPPNQFRGLHPGPGGGQGRHHRCARQGGPQAAGKMPQRGRNQRCRRERRGRHHLAAGAQGRSRVLGPVGRALRRPARLFAAAQAG